MISLWTLMACTGLSDAERLAQAMDPSVPLPQAISGCEGIQGLDAQGDCLSAAVELRDGTLEDCQQIRSERWRNECVFVLAERKSGEDLAHGIALCGETFYGRECVFHLIQDSAQGASGLPPIQAEAALKPFLDVKRAPDAPVLFWKEWVLHRVRVLDQAVPEAFCGELADASGCEGGLKKARKEMIRGVPSAERCSRVLEGAPLLQLADGREALGIGPVELEEIRRTCAAPRR